MAKGTVKLTISIPPNLMVVADEVASEKRIRQKQSGPFFYRSWLKNISQ